MKKIWFLSALVVLIFMGCTKKADGDTQGQNELTQEADVQTQAASSEQNQVEEQAPEKGSYKYIRSIHPTQEYTTAVRELTQDYLLGRWSVEVISEEQNYVSISFDDDGTYYIYSPFGGYLGQHGSYRLDGNSVTLSFPDHRESRWDDLIFPDGKETTFVYDCDFKDFYNIGVLRNENIILRNGVEETPVGEKCFFKGIEVIKTDNTAVVVKENLKIRYEPSTKGKEGSFWYPLFLKATLRDILENSYYDADTEKGSSNSLLQGTVTAYDARTVKEDTIDGITAPWYRINIYDYEDEGIPQYFWVFGGYLEKYDERKEAEYNQQLFNAAMQKDMFIIDENAYHDYMETEARKKVSEIAKDSVEKISKAGNVADSEEKLEGTVFKIGMTGKEVMDLLGAPPKIWNADSNDWEWPDSDEYKRGLKSDKFMYWLDYGGCGYHIIITFTNDRLSKVVTEYEK
ncbi:MAG: hypothetical protein J5857_03750 [Treponema sp.]|nr:hypothetical protein [Treponema sp.]